LSEGSARAIKLTILWIFLQWKTNVSIFPTTRLNLATQRLLRVQIQDTIEQVCVRMQVRIDCKTKERDQVYRMHTLNRVGHASWHASRPLLVAVMINEYQEFGQNNILAHARLTPIFIILKYLAEKMRHP
jgi:hypothetical protein